MPTYTIPQFIVGIEPTGHCVSTYSTTQNHYIKIGLSPFSFTPQSASFHQAVLQRIADRHRYGYPQIPKGIIYIKIGV